jgi:hypothetical protein
MKRGTVLKISHPAYGEYGLVVRSNKKVTTLLSSNNMQLEYETADIVKYIAVGVVELERKYRTTPGRIFQNVRCGQRFESIIVRDDRQDCELTSVPEIRAIAFLMMFGAKHHG